MTTTDSEAICPHCGQAIQGGEKLAPAGPQAATEPHSGQESQEAPPEYDHRGLMLPRRTRIGGIIAPQ